jgi:hypothetical protein
MSPCEARGLWVRYTQAPARDRVVTWGDLLHAHAGRFMGQCPGSVLVGGRDPCDRGPECTALVERQALLAWDGAGRPGLPLAWLEFQAAHGGRCHVSRSALRFGGEVS